MTNVGKVVVDGTTANGLVPVPQLKTTKDIPVPFRVVDMVNTDTSLLRAITSELNPLGGFTITWKSA